MFKYMWVYTWSSWTYAWIVCCTDIVQTQGLYSVSGSTSYRNISWSVGAARCGSRLFSINLIFDRHLGTSTVEMSVKLQCDRIIITPRSCGETPARLLNRGLGGCFVPPLLAWVWVHRVTFFEPLVLTKTRGNSRCVCSTDKYILWQKYVGM